MRSNTDIKEFVDKTIPERVRQYLIQNVHGVQVHDVVDQDEYSPPDSVALKLAAEIHATILFFRSWIQCQV